MSGEKVGRVFTISIVTPCLIDSIVYSSKAKCKSVAQRKHTTAIGGVSIIYYN